METQNPEEACHPGHSQATVQVLYYTLVRVLEYHMYGIALHERSASSAPSIPVIPKHFCRFVPPSSLIFIYLIIYCAAVKWMREGGGSIVKGGLLLGIRRGVSMR